MKKKEFKNFLILIQFDYSCINFTSPIIIGAKYSSTFHVNLVFYKLKCQNGTQEGIICKSEEEINNLLQDER